MDLIPAADLGLGSRLLDLVKNWPLGGGAVGVVRGDSSQWVETFGMANIDSRVPVAPGHLFEIGSISKIVTSIVIGNLEHEGLLDLDEPASKYLPWLELPGPSSTATLRHLLQHTAGIICGSDGLADERAQAWFLRNTSTGSSPGEFFHYSNAGFQILGLVAAAVADESLAEATNSRFLEPAGMLSTRAEISNRDRQSFAVGYAPAEDDRLWIPGEPIAPATWLETTAGDGHVASTVEDMLRFARVLIGRGELEGRTIIPQGYFNQMISSLAPEGEEILQLGNLVPVSSSRYGLGINVEQTRFGIQLSHGGGMVGFATFLLVDLESELGVVVLTNSNGDSPIAELVAREVHAQLVGIAAEQKFELDPSRWNPQEKMLGRFESNGRSISIRSDNGEVRIEDDRGSERIFRTLSEGVTSGHPDFRLHRLVFSEESGVPTWIYGDIEFRASDDHPQDRDLVWQQFEGHYRSYSPWFSNFRVYQRGGKLYLDATGGVEAPTSEMQLVPMGEGEFRVGQDPRLPERIRFEVVEGGQTLFAERDGHRYARVSGE
ncbi:MAG: beta-lactamase family protein [Cryobacterium sp.]|nr:beta-lactamase family protein [Cryobacterium sp.]MBX3090797.1 beta-lactamase family protein [Cryobacterium sp.]MBX3115977.1 beta-lactamase family protein [Cryobacterium sp.]